MINVTERERITEATVKWFVYMVKCSDDSLYTGITTDVGRRVFEHNCSKKGAKYTRCRRPVSLIWHIEVTSGGRSEAASLEFRIKKLSKLRKISLSQSADCEFLPNTLK